VLRTGILPFANRGRPSKVAGMSFAGFPPLATDASAAPPITGAASADAPPDRPPAPDFRTLYARTAHLQSFCILTVLTWLAACDGWIGPEERELLRKVAEAGENPGELAIVIEVAQLGRADDLELACRFLARHLDRGGRRLLIGLAVTMAVQDGRLTVGENLILQFLADLLGVSPRAFAKLFRQATHRPFPVAGDPSSIAWWRRREAGGQAEPAADDWGADHSDRTGATAASSDGPMDRTRALAVLGLGPRATAAEAHAAYRRLAKVRHPDRFTRLGPAAVQTATAAFERLHMAYAVVSAAAPAQVAR
jgi:uncharacterized tellurite resistance protein B-like protein